MVRAPKNQRLSPLEFQFVEGIDDLLAPLAQEQRQRVLEHVLRKITLIPGNRAGPLVREIARIIPRGKTFSIKDVRQLVRERGIEANKQKFNDAFFYLHKAGKIRRVGHARYATVNQVTS
jgi:hypothetical protein